ncbi:MAG TPA: hypothetical protein VF786_01535 [Terriglobales bacterium]
MRAHVVAVLLLATAAFSQELEKPRTITATGCVMRGVEAGCYVLRDVKTGAVYDLRWSGKLPVIGQGIRIVATPQPSPSTCMQGSAVIVQKWEAVSLPECATNKAVQTPPKH